MNQVEKAAFKYLFRPARLWCRFKETSSKLFLAGLLFSLSNASNGFYMQYEAYDENGNDVLTEIYWRDSNNVYRVGIDNGFAALSLWPTSGQLFGSANADTVYIGTLTEEFSGACSSSEALERENHYSNNDDFENLKVYNRNASVAPVLGIDPAGSCFTRVAGASAGTLQPEQVVGKTRYIRKFAGSALDAQGRRLLFDRIESLVYNNNGAYDDPVCPREDWINGRIASVTLFGDGNTGVADYPEVLPLACRNSLLYVTFKAIYKHVEDGPDADGDGIPDAFDNCPAIANANQNDGDQDQIGDLCDLVFNGDSDGDSILDGVDNCRFIPNANQANFDGDALGDVCDPDKDGDRYAETNGPHFPNSVDSDGTMGFLAIEIGEDVDTGLFIPADNCPSISNPDQLDTDGDGIGDACEAAPDADGDGVHDGIDNCPAIANPDQTDADRDGVGDTCDSCKMDASNDADGDGVCGDVDNCLYHYNPSQGDSDGDGVGDICDNCRYDAANDADGDGVCGNIDNCPAVANETQLDADNDGFGDACNAGIDNDGDEWSNILDNCPADFNPDQLNMDGDVLGDVCDVCPADAANDADGDGFCADTDNCPLIANPDQLDTDNDSKGNACDSDVDGDSVADTSDNCPLVANGLQEDADQDGIGDVCDMDNDNDSVSDDVDQCLVTANAAVVDSDGCAIAQLCPAHDNWKNHGAYVRCVAKTAESFLADGLISEEEKDAEISAAGNSDIGKKIK